MNLNTLENFDRRTAEGVLAAAALATAPNPGVAGVPALLNKYFDEAQAVLTEIRSRLRISVDDDSASARAAVDNVLSGALEGLIINPQNRANVFGRVGQSGRLSPVFYEVVQTAEFKKTFYALGIRSSHVEDAVRHPDDHQHLMTDGLPENAKAHSLFMKRIDSKDQRNSHWLLVQTHRVGLNQIAQSAWRIYPDAVDLSEARQPIDVLRMFAEVFGCPISVGDKKAKFVDPQQFPPHTQVKIDWTGAPREVFVSFSQTQDAEAFRIGLAYCIDVARYRASLKRHGIKVAEPTSN
jgi:hypothetical protein